MEKSSPRFSFEEKEIKRKKRRKKTTRTLDDYAKACMKAKAEGKFLTYKEWASEEYIPKVVAKNERSHD